MAEIVIVFLALLVVVLLYGFHVVNGSINAIGKKTKQLLSMK